MKVDWATFSEAGRQSRNQDFILEPLVQGDVMWTAVADGIGGARGGEIASHTAIMTVAKLVSADPLIENTLLFAEAKRSVELEAKRRPDVARMGTTLSAIRIAGNKCALGHVGDGRVYHLRGEGIATKSRDQTEVQRLLDEGILRKDEAQRYPRRNVLLSSLSATGTYSLFETTFDVLAGDRIVMTTDGVHGLVRRKEMRDLCRATNSASEFAASLRQRIIDEGPIDDYSCVALFF